MSIENFTDTVWDFFTEAQCQRIRDAVKGNRSAVEVQDTHQDEEYKFLERYISIDRPFKEPDVVSVCNLFEAVQRLKDIAKNDALGRMYKYDTTSGTYSVIIPTTLRRDPEDKECLIALEGEADCTMYDNIPEDQINWGPLCWSGAHSYEEATPAFVAIEQDESGAIWRDDPDDARRLAEEKVASNIIANAS